MRLENGANNKKLVNREVQKLKNSFILKKQESGGDKFILFWSKLYYYKYEEKYTSRIEKPEFSKEDIEELFVWKNGSKLSRKKAKGFVKYVIDNLILVNQLKKDYDENLFKEKFGERPTIWQIFLMHLIQPNEYPLFDQHTYRAFRYLQKGEIIEIPKYNKSKLSIYFKEYLPFFRELNFENKKKIDEALFAFGKFLKLYSLDGKLKINNINGTN